jgi:flavin-dependent dehydrogenase
VKDSGSIVIGGGLGGSAFAIELARQGHSVTVLEKTAAAHHKVCGEFLSAEAQNLLEQLGLDVWQLGARPASQLALEIGGVTERVSLPFRGAGLSRYVLDQALLDAAERAGARVIRDSAVTNLEISRRCAVVHTAAEQFAADRVVLATGKHNLRGWPRAGAPTVAFKMQLDVSPATAASLSDLVQLVVLSGGYGGACLIEGGIATICWVINRDTQPEMPVTWDAHAQFLARCSRFFAELLSGATPRWNRPVAIAAIPYGFLRRTVISDTVYPVGDQLVVIPSYTGDGTSIALHTGMAAARAVACDQSASEYQTSVIAKLKPQITWAKIANVAFVNVKAQRATSAIARAFPWAVPALTRLVVNKTRLRV